MSEWELIDLIPSDTTDEWYRIEQNRQGHRRCNCKNFRFCPGEIGTVGKTCKHIKRAVPPARKKEAPVARTKVTTKDSYGMVNMKSLAPGTWFLSGDQLGLVVNTGSGHNYVWFSGNLDPYMTGLNTVDRKVRRVQNVELQVTPA